MLLNCVFDRKLLDEFTFSLACLYLFMRKPDRGLKVILRAHYYLGIENLEVISCGSVSA